MGLRRLVAACSLTAASLGLAACGSDSEGPVAGELIAAVRSDQFQDGTKSRVLVPTGVLRVWIEEPAQELAAEETRDQGRLDAAPETSYVPITWSYDTARFDKISAFLNTDATPTVDLRTGEHSYRLPPPSRQTPMQSFYVVVDGDAEDLTLAVDFDGVTQMVDLRTGNRTAGQAEGLYDLGKLDVRAHSCGDRNWFNRPRTAAQFTCEISGPVVLPYAGGRWADSEHRWLAVGVHTTLSLYGELDGQGGGAHWRGSRVTTELTLGKKRRPSSVIRADNTDDICPDRRARSCKYSALAIFEVGKKPPSSMQLQQTYDLAPHSSWGGFIPKDQPKARADGVIDLR